MFLRLAGTLVLVVLCVHAPAGQQQDATPSPIFRAQVDAVELDAFVTDAAGNPVTDLTAADFEIVEGNVRQTITSFALVNVPIERLERPLSSPTAIEPDVFTNRAPEGRLYVIALDEVAPALALRTRNFLRRFLETQFAANDVAALVYVGRGNSSHTQDFTSNRRLLLQALDRFSGGFGSDIAPTSGASQEGTFMTRSRIRALRDLVEFMAGLRGRRKTMIYVTSTIGEVYEVLDYHGGSGASPAFHDFHAMMTAATRGNVAIYPVDPAGLSTSGGSGESEGPTGGGSSLTNTQNMRALADATGGFAFINSNNFNTAFERIVRENSVYYVLGYTSTNDRRDGRYRSVQIRVTRPGLQVRARDGYVAPLRGAPAPRPVQTSRVSAPIGEALRLPLANAAVPMAVSAVPFRGSGRDSTVALAVEMDGSRLGLVKGDATFDAQIEVAAAAVNAAGRIFRGEFHRAGLTLKPDTYQRAVTGGVRFVGELVLPPGRYQLRVAAGNTTGQVGSVVADLEVPDFTKRPLVLSGVAVTSDGATGMVTFAPKTPLDPILPAPPSATRAFRRGDVVTLYAEVYDNERKRPHTVSLRAQLRSDDGRVLQTVTDERSSADLDAKGRGYGFRPTITLDVEPGLYVIRIEATANIRDRAEVMREILIRVNRGDGGDGGNGATP